MTHVLTLYRRTSLDARACAATCKFDLKRLADVDLFRIAHQRTARIAHDAKTARQSLRWVEMRKRRQAAFDARVMRA